MRVNGGGPLLGTTQEDVDAVGGLEEAHFPRLVAANQGNDDDIALLSLEASSVSKRSTQELSRQRGAYLSTVARRTF